MHLGWTHKCQKVKSIPPESVNHFFRTDVSGPGAFHTWAFASKPRRTWRYSVVELIRFGYGLISVAFTYKVLNISVHPNRV